MVDLCDIVCKILSTYEVPDARNVILFTHLETQKDVHAIHLYNDMYVRTPVTTTMSTQLEKKFLKKYLSPEKMEVLRRCRGVCDPKVDVLAVHWHLVFTRVTQLEESERLK